ncbi:MAG: Gfo/Idh/MocA family protein [Chloroflexota bacterium]|jgi:predicted dehydrogenase
MQEPVRIGVIGAGGMGSSHAQSIQTLQRARVAAVSDSDETRGRKLADEMGVPWFGDYQRMLRDGSIDAVSIASPPFLHTEMALAAAAAGKHIFCEKPMAVNVADCETMIQAAERAGVTLMVGQVLRFLQPFLKVRELVDSGAVGRVIAVEVTRIAGGFGAASAPWRQRLEQSGGLLLEINAHEIDLLRCLGGDVASVYAEADNFVHPDADYPDLAFVLLRYRNGGIGCLYSSSASSLGETSGTVQGTEGAIRYNGWGKRGTVEVRRRGDERPTVIRLEELETQPGVAYELDRFAEALLTGKPPIVSGLDGLKVVEIARAAYTSATEHRSLPLPER